MTDRDSSGKFVSGNTGGPGRPKRKFEEKYILALTNAVSEGQWQAIITRAISDAQRGDWRARQWLADYIIGKPVQQLDIDTTNKVLQVQYVNDWRGDNVSQSDSIEEIEG